MRPLPGRLLKIALAVTALAAVCAASAFGELVQRGNLFIRFDGGITPNALPRRELAPIAVASRGRSEPPPARLRPACAASASPSTARVA